MAIDPLTKQEFSPSRANQLFANRRNQISYNNKKQSEKRKQKASIDAILSKNRDILLEALDGKNEIIIPEQVLISSGLVPKYHTHSMKIENKVCPSIYEIILQKQDNGTIKIIRDGKY